MKKLLGMILLIVLSSHSFGQTKYINVCVDCNNLEKGFCFNAPTDSSGYYFEIDTLQQNNLWQKGIPSKTTFKSGYWGPKAFVTDTVNPYPVNNISSFQFTLVQCSYWTYGPCGDYLEAFIQIRSKINSDSTMDGGTIEVSHNGAPFINLIEDSLAIIKLDIYSIHDTIKSMGKPGFSGNSYGWDSGWYATTISYRTELVHPFDTITFRLTFSSDSIQTNKDGWMIGEISMSGMFWGIEEIQNNDLISVSPNPANQSLNIQRKQDVHFQKVLIFNYNGQIFFDHPNFTGDVIDTKHFPNGIYFLKYSDSKNNAIKKFVVQH